MVLSKLPEVDIGSLEYVVVEINLPLLLDMASAGSFVGKFVETLPMILKNLSVDALEEISTQNGPPKKNNKIIFINFGGRKGKNYFFCSYF